MRSLLTILFLVGACLYSYGHAGVTAEDIYGESEGGSRDISIFHILLMLIFYGPFIYALLNDKSTRRMLFFMTGSVSSVAFLAGSISRINKEWGIIFAIAMFIFWLIFGEKIVDIIMDHCQSKKIDSTRQGSNDDNVNANQTEQFNVVRNELSQVAKATFKPAVKSLDEKLMEKAEKPQIPSIELNTGTNIKEIKSKNIVVDSSAQKTPVLLMGIGWKHDKSNKILWNDSTKEVLRTSSGLGYSYTDTHFILYNRLQPRKILRVEVTEAKYVGK